MKIFDSLPKKLNDFLEKNSETLKDLDFLQLFKKYGEAF